MTDVATNPVDGEAMPEVVDALAGESEGLEPIEANQDDAEPDPEDGEGDEPDPDADLEDVEWEGKTLKLPKGVKEAMLRQADYTQKTQAIAEEKRQVETTRQRLQAAEQHQAAFVQEIATLGALNDRIAAYQPKGGWPNYLRTGGAEAAARYAEFQALSQQRDAFASALGQKVQDREAEMQREAAKQIEAGRAELGKHIKGYGPETLDKLVTFGASFGFSPEEIREAEADPRSIRVLHLASLGQQLLSQRKRTETLAQGQRTKPATTLNRGAGGRIAPKADTDDFRSFERHYLGRG